MVISSLLGWCLKATTGRWRFPLFWRFFLSASAARHAVAKNANRTASAIAFEQNLFVVIVLPFQITPQHF
jgi:hypothetical protein